MAVTTPTLGGVTLPMPWQYSEVGGYRGGNLALANGGVHFDVVNATYKRVWLLAWRALTAAQKTAVLNAYATVKTASATFVSPDGVTATVTRSQGQSELEWGARTTVTGDWLWETSMELREV